MAEVQTGDSGSEKGGKHKKVRAKKQSTHIDMTPMVDLAFLLLTFFMLTTTFGKPKTMEINMPVKDDVVDSNKVFGAMTILLTEKDQIFWYSGAFKPETVLSKTDFSNEGIRKLLLENNKSAVNKIKELREEAARTNMPDSTLKRREVDIKGEKNSLMVLVKTDDKAKYRNVVDMLDELNIAFVGKYALVDISQPELDLINAQPK